MKAKSPLQIQDPVVWSFYLLLLIGFLQVYSSSSIYAMDHFGDSWFFIKKQLIYVIAAGGFFYIARYIPQRLFMILGALVFVASFFGVLLTLVPSLGVQVGGAKRWLPVVSGFRIQPGEFLKFSFPFFIYWLLAFKEKYEKFSFWWPFSLVFFCSLGLFYLQPDFGSLVLLTLSVLVALFFLINGFRFFVFLSSLGGLALLILLFQKSYRIQRVLTFLNPWKDPQGQGYQTIQSFVAFKKGGFFGEGIGMSQSKFFFLPEAHTDFTLAVFAEEFGFFGVFLLATIFIYFTFRLLKKSKEQSDFKVFIMGYSLASLFFFYFFINFCVNLGLLPTKGLPLPFLSYGGSTLLAVTFGLSFFRTLKD